MADLAMNPLERLKSGGNVLNGLAMLGILGLMMLPVAPAFLDLLLTFNITFAVVVLLMTVYLKEPMEFSVFPSVLLMVTLTRLSLNVASTRLILSNGYAGEVINSFGNFVVGGNYVIGFVIFLILIVIQFVVITKGAGRIAEVAARFTLDAMPGKQMSIDADLNAGIIDESEAKKRRKKISREADFYGAMDGASKFVRGDAIAGIIITIVNIIGGLVVGMMQRDLSAMEALRTYTLLTVGDGLVTQIPALIVSTGAGMVVTRGAGESDFADEFGKQVMNYPRVMLVAAISCATLGLVPGLPKVPFFLIGAICGGLYYIGQRRLERAEAPQESEETEAPGEPLADEDLFYVDPLELEIGYGLIPLVDKTRGGDLLKRLTNLRRQSASDYGLHVAPIRVRDNVQLKPNEYAIKLKGAEIARGRVHPDHALAMGRSGVEADLGGIKTTEPVFGLPAVWIRKDERESAEVSGYTVVECEGVIATHLSEIVKKHAAEIMTRQDVKDLVDKVRKNAPAVVDDLVPDKASLGFVQQVLGNLLREQVPIRDMVTILETISNYADTIKDPDVIAEKVRESLARIISRQYAGTDNQLNVLSLDPVIEEQLMHAMAASERTGGVALEPALATRLLRAIEERAERAVREGFQPILICSGQIRLFLKRLCETSLPSLVVLSFNEVARGVNAKSIGMVNIND